MQPCIPLGLRFGVGFARYTSTQVRVVTLSKALRPRLCVTNHRHGMGELANLLSKLMIAEVHGCPSFALE